MGRLPWTKLQDFYLRLGFLKVLVAASSPDRRSVQADSLIRRMETPLFQPASSVPALWEHVRETITWYRADHAKGRKLDQPSVAEALLVSADHPSYLYAITKNASIKIVDWGRDVEFLGAGHQITERGLLLRSHIPQSGIDAFFDGQVLAWNPFTLDLEERLLFLYHLSELDHVTLELASDVGQWNQEGAIDATDAARLVCGAILRVLGNAQSALRALDVPTYRAATDLVKTIASELKMEHAFGESKLGGGRASAIVVPRLPPTKKFIGVDRGSRSGRVGQKNADHQTIPRVEQLVDLGFLEKPKSDDSGRIRESRRRWRYVPTSVARRWSDARRQKPCENHSFLKCGFANAAVFAFHGRETASQEPADVSLVADYFWRGYQRVGRRHGNSPLDSIALDAMTLAASEGKAIEMVHFERLMVAIKRLSALPEHVYFAGGNDLDKMFVRLKPDFLRALAANKSSISAEYSKSEP